MGIFIVDKILDPKDDLQHNFGYRNIYNGLGVYINTMRVNPHDVTEFSLYGHSNDGYKIINMFDEPENTVSRFTL